MADLKNSSFNTSITTPEIRNIQNVAVINVDDITTGSNHLRKYAVQRDLVSRSFSTTWSIGPVFDPINDFKSNSDIIFYYLIPMRNNSSTWGGAYIEPQIRYLSKNMITNSNLDIGWNKSYQQNIVFNEITPPSGVDSQVVGHDLGSGRNGGGYWYSYDDYAPMTKGSTYTVSLYVKTVDPDLRVRPYTADNSETGRVYGEYITVPADGNWHRIVWDAITNPENSQAHSLSFQMQYATLDGGPDSRSWFCAPQMELGEVASEFVDGTTDWESMGSCGYDGGVMGRSGSNNPNRIVSYRNTILLKPQKITDFSVQIQFYCRSYDGTATWNGSRDIGQISNTAPLLNSTINDYHHAHIKVKELARFN